MTIKDYLKETGYAQIIALGLTFLLTVVGSLLLFVIYPFFKTDSLRFNEAAKGITGTITEVTERSSIHTETSDLSSGKEYDITIEYEVDGKKYTHHFVSDTHYKVGNQRTVYYSTANPTEAHMSLEIDNTAAVVGCLFLVCGFIPFIIVLFLFIGICHAIAYNHVVYISDWKFEETLVDNKYMLRIVCTDRTTDKPKYYKSAPFDPGRCQFCNGEAIAVYVDIWNSKNYFIPLKRYR